MKNWLIRFIAFALPSFGVLPSGNATESTQAASHAVLEAYEQALNTSDVGAVVKLYTGDGVFNEARKR